jgi:hypothetical protein
MTLRFLPVEEGRALPQQQLQPLPMSDGLALLEQMRIKAGIVDTRELSMTRELCLRSAVPYIQYLEARLGMRELTTEQLERMMKAIMLFDGAPGSAA